MKEVTEWTATVNLKIVAFCYLKTVFKDHNKLIYLSLQVER